MVIQDTLKCYSFKISLEACVLILIRGVKGSVGSRSLKSETGPGKICNCFILGKPIRRFSPPFCLSLLPSTHSSGRVDTSASRGSAEQRGKEGGLNEEIKNIIG